jgi:prephenate dehydrogenase
MQTTARRTRKKPVIGIIGGTSPFGQWFKTFFKNNGCVCLVAGRQTALTPRELAAQADIVIVSVPIRETAKTIRSIRSHVRPGALLCDFTSIKTESLPEMLKSDKHIGVLGIHPLFGPLVPSLKEQNIVFTPGRNNAWVIFLKTLFKKNGAKVIVVSAAEHDRQMALVQALNHFVNLAFAGALHRQRSVVREGLSTPVFRSQADVAARILGGDPSLYADIELRNPAFRPVLKRFLAEAKKLGAILTNRRTAAFEKNYRVLAKSVSHLTKNRPRISV